MWPFSFSKVRGSKNKDLAKNRINLAENLKRMYHEKLIPLEEHSCFHSLHSFRIENSDFEAKPMVLLIGQYSTGKTSFIRSVIEQDYPGMRIGPEPTTDAFTIVTGGPNETIVPGNALCSDHSLPFSQLANFGNAFLNRLQMSMLPSCVLDDIVFIDTPGIAAGAKHHKVHRGYDFTKVIGWFANHADRIILFFDACKLDISDELKKIIEIVRDNDEKLRIVFNKADLLSEQELMRGYGALMWFLGRALPCPEPSRLYIGSFHMGRMRNDDNRWLIELEVKELYEDLQNLPRMAAIKKINDVIKRARQVKVHAFIMSELYNFHQLQTSVVNKKFSSLFSPARKNRENLLERLPDVFEKLQRRNDLNLGDFPILKALHERLSSCDFEKKLKPLKQNLMDDVDKMLNFDAAPLMAIILCGQPIPPYASKPLELDRNWTLTRASSSNLSQHLPRSSQQSLVVQSATSNKTLPFFLRPPSALKTSASTPNTKALESDDAGAAVFTSGGEEEEKEEGKENQKPEEDLEVVEEEEKAGEEGINPEETVAKGSEKRKFEEAGLAQYSRPYSKASKTPLVSMVPLAPLNILKDTPFAPGRYEGLNAGSERLSLVGSRNKGSTIQSSQSTGAYCAEDLWGIEASRRLEYGKVFLQVAGEDGKASGYNVREEFLKSRLPNAVLAKIWRLSDMDRDNCLDEDEFAVAMYLIDMKLMGFELPQVVPLSDASRSATMPRGGFKQPLLLPLHLIPPSKRHLFQA